jgi:DNA (cytosine-5)-methyltransferase 1
VLRVGSLCSGYGGLDGAACEQFGAEVAWVADNDPAASKVLAERYPGVPNLGDIAAVEWEEVPPVDIATMGFPCQDVSSAGLGAGLLRGNRSGTWYHCAVGLAVLRPRLVIIENVRGLLSARAHSGVEPCPGCLGEDGVLTLRALGAVLGDLSDLGFDAEWQVVSAADVGGCHRRERVFIMAWPAADPSVAADAGSNAGVEWRLGDSGKRP